MFSEATVLVAVLAGLASFVSPCVLPLLPGYLSLMSGYSVDELQTGEVSLRRVTGKTLLFIGGFTAVFVAPVRRRSARSSSTSDRSSRPPWDGS